MAQAQTKAHPEPKQYVQIALLLAVLTGVEVALYYIEQGGVSSSIVYPTLIILAALKFVIVVAFYMHVRYEKSLIARFFTVGFFGALMLYTVVLGTFGVLASLGGQ
ncbi:MAG: cytochrome C oxidase subunit IV family protein [Acidimicrobiia bacterium]|nr:cytochrome C oxidase subunit IV family protein [Acidimicrobiia bacterium]